MKPLFLILKKEYFNQIKSGQKTVEYRTYNEFWLNRLTKGHQQVIFQLGYSSQKRIICDIQKIDIELIKHDFFGLNPVEVFAIYLCNTRDYYGSTEKTNK